MLCYYLSPVRVLGSALHHFFSFIVIYDPKCLSIIFIYYFFCYSSSTLFHIPYKKFCCIRMFLFEMVNKLSWLVIILKSWLFNSFPVQINFSKVTNMCHLRSCGCLDLFSSQLLIRWVKLLQHTLSSFAVSLNFIPSSTTSLANPISSAW